VAALAPAFAAADWDLAGYIIVTSQPWYGPGPAGDRGCVTLYEKNIATTTIGDRVFVHFVYTECPHAVGGGESYYIKYRRGYYDIPAGAGNFTWDAGFENGAVIISGPVTQPPIGRFKTEPTIAAAPNNRLYAFWADSRHCNESSGVWDNIEIYGNTAALSTQPAATWSWLSSPRRVSAGLWLSDVPAVTFDLAGPLGPNAFIFWRDGREAEAAAERTDIYAATWSEDLIKYPAGGWRLAQNGGLTLLGEYDCRDGRIAAATDAAGTIHVVWSDQRPGDRCWSVYYKRRVGGSWTPDVCLPAVCQVAPRTEERHPQLAVITLAGAPAPGRYLVVMASTGAYWNPVMYVF